MKWKIADEAREEKPVRLVLDIKPTEAKEIASAIADSGFYPYYPPLLTMDPPSTSARDEMLKALRAVAKL